MENKFYSSQQVSEIKKNSIIAGFIMGCGTSLIIACIAVFSLVQLGKTVSINQVTTPNNTQTISALHTKAVGTVIADWTANAPTVTQEATVTPSPTSFPTFSLYITDTPIYVAPIIVPVDTKVYIPPIIVPVDTKVYIPPVQNEHPAGTSGRCKDGTYTYAAHKQGACSHHGGVAKWWGN